MKIRSCSGSRVPIWTFRSSPNDPTVVRKSPIHTSPPFWMEMKTGLGGFWAGGATARGSVTGTDTVASGAATMKMMRRTSIMSTKGVTLISLFASTVYLPPPEPESLAAIRLRSLVELTRDRVDQLSVEPVGASAVRSDAGVEVVIEDNRRDSREQADTGGQQGFSDTRSN